MKKLFLTVFLIFAIISPACAGTDYVLMALQPYNSGTQWQFINGAETHEVPIDYGHVLATSGPWSMVLFRLKQIKPVSWSVFEAADWLADADGFLAFDYRMLYEGERLGASIQGRTFDYSDVMDVVINLEWWTESGGEYTRSTGDRAAWAAAGYPKMSRVLPQPQVFLGNCN